MKSDWVERGGADFCQCDGNANECVLLIERCCPSCPASCPSFGRSNGNPRRTQHRTARHRRAYGLSCYLRCPLPGITAPARQLFHDVSIHMDIYHVMMRPCSLSLSLAVPGECLSVCRSITSPGGVAAVALWRMGHG